MSAIATTVLDSNGVLSPYWPGIHEALSEPFAPERVHWRIGSTTQDKKRGMALAYIDARDVMDRLDEVVGSGNWESRFRDAAGRVVCELTIFGVTKSDGAGDTAVEAEKGGISDAFKRAAVHFGIGRYLYRLAAPWVELDASGKRIAPHEMERLGDLLRTGNSVGKTDFTAVPAHIAHNPFGPREEHTAPAPAAPAKTPVETVKEVFPDAQDGPYVYPAGSPPPEEPKWKKWKEDALKGGKMKGKTWGEIAQGSFGGQRYQWARSIMVWDEAKPDTQLRAANCVYEIETRHQGSNQEDF